MAVTASVSDTGMLPIAAEITTGRAEKIVFKLLSIGIECSQLRDIIPVSISQGDYGEVTAVIIYGILGDMQGDALGILPVGRDGNLGRTNTRIFCVESIAARSLSGK